MANRPFRSDQFEDAEVNAKFALNISKYRRWPMVSFAVSYRITAFEPPMLVDFIARILLMINRWQIAVKHKGIHK